MLLAGADQVYLLCIFIARWELSFPQALPFSEVQQVLNVWVNQVCLNMLNYVIDQISAGQLFQSIGALNIKAVLQGKKKQQKKVLPKE